MSQTAIPLEFEKYLQNKVSLQQPTELNEIIFAMIPDLDLSQPIDRTASLPPLEQWVFQQDVDQIGKSGSNSVVYSVVISGSTAPFTFNAMYLRDKNVPNSCGMVVYKATETKETGMALTKSLLMQFDGAAAAANVKIDAATWQIDYQARLKGIDEDHRLSCLDIYGHTAFFDGFDVTRHEIDQTKYLIEPGIAYIGGLRVHNSDVKVITVNTKPTPLWIDVYRDGTALSQHKNTFQIIATADNLVDYIDGDNRHHYVTKLARIEADGSIVDLRVKGGLAEHLADTDPHPQYITTEELEAALQSLGDEQLKSMVGMVVPFHNAGPLSGWVDLIGGELSRETDKPLWDYAVAAGMVTDEYNKNVNPRGFAMYFGTGNGVDTFTLPNHHLGHFVRGTPSGVQHASVQGDAIRNITSAFYTNNGWIFSNATGAMKTTDGTMLNANSTTLAGAKVVSPSITFDASRVVPVADENRPHTANLSIKIHRGWM
ncbi:phage tail protein [Vibrio neptunius]|uniref:phage tail-collar fiber domain-containing protein n=1 Tax=Vibrio neptunius TaxID=170651 RepID=UPI0033150A59